MNKQSVMRVRTVRPYPASKRTGILSAWMDLEDIVLREMSDAEGRLLYSPTCMAYLE